MRIAVYALCKNEANNIDPWFASCREADLFVVTDTGSTDGSLVKLDSLPTDNLRLHHARIIPWRFDDAFNHAMNNVPDDVDVCIRLDFDERLQPGWRKALEEEWTPETTRLRYPYVWNWKADGTPDRQWLGDRIHSRRNYRWTGATHEGLVCRGEEHLTWTRKLAIHQFPEVKDRPNDLPLLEEAVRDTPNDARLWGYLGREYVFKKMPEEAAKTLKHFLTMKSATQERVQAFCYLAKAEPESAVYWLKEGAKEGPEYREPLVDLAMHHYKRQEWQECYEAAMKAIEIKSRPDSYITISNNYGSLPHDLAAVAAWNLGRKAEACERVEIALLYEPDNIRLQGNLKFMKNDGM